MDSPFAFGVAWQQTIAIKKVRGAGPWVLTLGLLGKEVCFVGLLEKDIHLYKRSNSSSIDRVSVVVGSSS